MQDIALDEQSVALPRQGNPFRFFVGAVSIVAAAAGLALRWVHLGRQSLWLDETFSAYLSRLSFTDIVRSARASDYTPVYFQILHVWQLAFGTSEFALRALSAFAGTLSILVFYQIAKRILNDSLALSLALWMFCFSVMQVWFSREARDYEVGALIGLLNVYALILLLERRTLLRYTGVILCIAASLYLHNMLFFYTAAIDLMWLVYPCARRWIDVLKEMVLANLVAGLLYLPWVPSLLRQVNSDFVHKGFWAGRPTAAILLRTMLFVAGFFPDYLSAMAGRLVPLPQHALWLATLFVIGIVSFTLMVWGLLTAPAGRKLISLMVYGFVPVALIFFLSRVSTPVFTDRVLTNSSLFFPIYFAAPLAFARDRSQRSVAAALLIFVAAAATISTGGYLRYTVKENWRGASAYVLSIPQPHRALVFVSRSSQHAFDYYVDRLEPGKQVPDEIGLPIGYRERFPPLPGDSTIFNPEDIGRLKAAVDSQKYPEIDLMLSHEQFADPHGYTLSYLDRTMAKKEEQDFYGIRVFRFFPAIAPNAN